MFGKRLFTIFMISIVIGGVIVSGALVFRVQTIDIVFHGGADYITDKDVAVSKTRLAALDVAKNKNIIFGLNRKRIIEAIEKTEKRVKVTNHVEAKFPNKLYITISERYAMYELAYQGSYAVLDAELRIVNVDNKPLNTGSRSTLVDITNVFDIKNFETAFVQGKDLADYLEPDSPSMKKVVTLKDMFRLLKSKNFNEAEIAHLVKSIKFEQLTLGTSETMKIEFRHQAGPDAHLITEIEIRNFEQFFIEKIDMAWEVYQIEYNRAARIIVDKNNGDFGELGNQHPDNIIPEGAYYALWIPRENP